MPNIIQSLIPNFAGDSVLVVDQQGNQVFRRARSMKAEVRPTSRPMEHPLESGAIITDHRILLPIEVELELVLQSADYKDTYKEIVHYYATGTLLTVQTKAGNFTNQLIQSIPHQEDSEHMDALLLALKLKQVLIAVTTQPTTVNTLQPNKQTTVDRGNLTGMTTPPSQAATPNAQMQTYLKNGLDEGATN